MTRTGTVRVSVTDGDGAVYAIHEVTGDALEWLAAYGAPQTVEGDTPDVITEILLEIADAASGEVAE